MIIEEGAITITRFDLQSNGMANFEIRYKPGGFCHVAFLYHVTPLEQTRENLLALAYKRLGL